MTMYDIIRRKRDGGALSKEEIDFFVEGYTNGSIPDYQASALLMAIYFQGMNREETGNLTLAMDKRSTGGVGDKTSLALLPMAAACSVSIAKMSGRGLGHTGGTIDKLESFPGFCVSLTTEQFQKQVNDIGIALMSQTGQLAPADKKLYALRDVTATVDQLSLIASSIMSKKLAAGADAIVLDVKTGSGAFMKTEKDAFLLAEEMVEIGRQAGQKTIAVVTDMDQPLGRAVGNALEVKEAIATLRGEGPEDFTNLCLTLGSAMLLAAGKAESFEEAKGRLKEVIANGKALEKLAELVEAQGGDRQAVYAPENLPGAAYQIPVLSPKEGYLAHMDCEEIGRVSMILGGGREKKEDEIDLSVGIVLKKKCGDFIKMGEPLALLHVNDLGKLEEARERFLRACHFSKEAPVPRPLIYKIFQ